MNVKKILCIILITMAANVVSAKSKQTIYMAQCVELNNKDITSLVRSTLAKIGTNSAKIIFPKGVYHFSPHSAYRKFHYITNHDAGYKHIAFNLEAMKNIEIDGQGSHFIFHGEIMPFLIQNCKNIHLRNFSIDWEIPFFIQGEVMQTSVENHWIDVAMFEKGFSFSLQNSRLKFPIEQGLKPFASLGEGLAFDKIRKSPIYNANAFDMHRTQEVKVEKLVNGNFRIYENLKAYPPLHSILVFKGQMGENRYAPAFHCLNSKNIKLSDVNVYHAPGMGFLGEKSDNIQLFKFNVTLPQGSDRYVSTTADATHFANCKGKIVMDSCLLENMLDDGTNVHGTYIEIDSVINSRTIVAKLKHFQQEGFVFAQKNDQVWFLVAPNPSRAYENSVQQLEIIDPMTQQITFRSALPAHLKKGDLVENKTWNPQLFVMRNCSVRHHRARNVVLKSPGKIRIHNNYFQSMMASILIRGEAVLWFESGAVENVIINDNFFENCVMGGGKQAVLHISPKLNARFDAHTFFDKKIVFKNNTVHTFDHKIVDAERVYDLRIEKNKIRQSHEFQSFHPNEPLLDIRNCKAVLIKNNVYKGSHSIKLKIDSVTKKSSTIKQNIGL